VSQSPHQIVGYGEQASVVSFRDAGSHVEIETSRSLTAHIGGEYTLSGWGRIRLLSAGARKEGGLRLTGQILSRER
jgi:hypothetical protein